MDKQLEFLKDSDEEIIDAEFAVCFTEDGVSEGGIVLTIGDDFHSTAITLSESDLKKMLEYVQNP